MSSAVKNRSEMLSNALREIEHCSDDNDELFYCSYILGLLGLHDHEDMAADRGFDGFFLESLQTSMSQENITAEDQKNIMQLWHKITLTT